MSAFNRPEEEKRKQIVHYAHTYIYKRPLNLLQCNEQILVLVHKSKKKNYTMKRRSNIDDNQISLPLFLDCLCCGWLHCNGLYYSFLHCHCCHSYHQHQKSTLNTIQNPGDEANKLKKKPNPHNQIEFFSTSSPIFFSLSQ